MSLPLPVRRIVPAYQQVADDLRALVLSGELAPGERLPTEQELCESFGVSRSTVREALRVLASQHLVTTTRGVTGGTFVAHPAPERLTDYMEASLGLLAGAEELDVTELLEARLTIEVPAAGLAAKRRKKAHLDRLRDSLEDGQAIQEHGFEGNRAFHEIVVEASGNRLLSVMATPILGVLRERFLRDAAPRTFWNKVAHDHGAILDAIEAGDSAAAEREMREHLGRLASTYKKIDRKSSR